MKILRSRKALSPVVASIILIAVTVAVSIAVAAWMGALTFNFMATEQIKITNVVFGPTTADVFVTMQNTGTSPVTVTEIHINNGGNLQSSQFTIVANSQTVANITLSGSTIPNAWVNGAQYEIEAKTSKGNQFTYTATAPS
jgi:flagellin-like protein